MIAQFRADLHCHTTCSDGSMTSAEVLSLAKHIGLKGISITDHDTVEAYKTAFVKAKKLNILLGSGVEFSCDFEETTVHVLGYDFLLDSPEIYAHCERHRARRADRNKIMLDKLARIGKPVDIDLSRTGQTIGRPHIAQAMIKRGYVTTLKEAFDLYLGEGKCCYERGTPFPIPYTIDIIKSARGKAFIAHPHLIENKKGIKQILDMPFDGLECYYGKSSPEKERRWIKLAKQKNWLMSGGSDFHGSVKPHVPLGCSWVDEETFYRIFTNLVK